MAVRASSMLLPALLVLSLVPDPQLIRAAAAQSVSEEPVDPLRATTHDVRRLQRLLKLLAARNPHRFASADPGVIDGVLGQGTIAAIKNFQRIIGVQEDPKVTNALFAQILTAHAEPPVPAPRPTAAHEATATNTAAVTQPGHAEAKADSKNSRIRYAQLGSVKDRERVDKEWKRLTQTVPALNNYQPVIEVANLKERGTYYRILVGPFEDFRGASVFCDGLRKQRRSCFVKKMAEPGRKAGNNLGKLAKRLQPKPEPADTVNPVAKRQPANDPGGKDVVSTPADPPAPVMPLAEPEPRVGMMEPDASAPRRAPLVPVERSPSVLAPAPIAPPAAAVGTTAAAQKPPDAAVAAERPQPEYLAQHDTAPRSVGKETGKSDQAISGDQRRQPVVAPATAAAQWLARADRYTLQSYIGPAVAATAGTCFGLLVVIWRQRRRRSLMLEAILVDPWFEDRNRDPTAPRASDEPTDLLEELKIQFEAADLVACRQVRDSFLDGIKELNEATAPANGSGENAMLVNRRMNQLLSSDPETYKAIFLNWIFLNHAAERIASSPYTLKRLDPRIQAEFRLVASLFKIHLLELEARHHVRQRLPNIFTALHELDGRTA